MMNIGEFQCACRFYRAEEFGEAKLVEPCGYHNAMQRRLDEAKATIERLLLERDKHDRLCKGENNL